MSDPSDPSDPIDMTPILAPLCPLPASVLARLFDQDGFTHRVVIRFDRDAGLFRADEMYGDYVVTHTIIEWAPNEDYVEDIAALYAAARELPVARYDVNPAALLAMRVRL
jgi:hypothetical protein